MSKSKNTGLLIALHIILWFVFLSLPTPFNPFRQELGLQGIIDDLMEPPRIANAILLIAVFYFNYYMAMPRLYLKRQYLLFFVTVLICFNCFFLLNYLMAPTHFWLHHSTAFSVLGNSFNLFMFIIVYSISSTLCLYAQWQKAKEQMQDAEISFLKAQINPHFLFNTLNSIYSLAIAKSDNAPEAIVKLSSLMRYTISESTQEKVPLRQEVHYITNYIDLQKLRLTSKIKISYTVSGIGDGIFIAPFLLIPFVENAFKHGVNSEENSDLKINIAINDGSVLLEVANNKVYCRQDGQKGIHLGIETTRKRLRLLYPGSHSLTIKDGKNDFVVSLKINLK